MGTDLAQSNSEGLEGRFGSVVVVGASQYINVKPDLQYKLEAIKKINMYSY